MKIILYKRPSSTYEYFKNKITQTLQSFPIEFEFVEISDVNTLITDNILNTPAIKIGNDILSFEHHDINVFVDDANTWIIEKFKNQKGYDLLIPIDFSEASENAATYAIHYAENTPVNSMNLFHFYHPNAIEIEKKPTYNFELEVQNKMVEITESLKSLPNLEIFEQIELKGKVVHGFAADEMIKLGEDNENSLIVIGSSGINNGLKYLLGSVTTKIAKNSTAPVLIIPPSSQYKKINRICFCTQNLDLDVIAIHKVIKFAKTVKAEIHLVHFNQNDAFNPQSIIKMMEEFYPKERLKYKEINGFDKYQSILKYIASEDIDILSMANESRGLFQELIHSSFTNKMIRNARIPMLVIHNKKNNL